MPKAVRDWRPSCAVELRRLRAEVNGRIREFFRARGVLEVETPLWSRFGTTDPAIESVAVAAGGYLRTSPEFAHKRLLAAGSGPIYELGRVFRAAESGRFHHPEFTMLEWYRPGFDQQALMAEVEELLVDLHRSRGQAAESVFVSHADLIQEHCGLDPRQASDAQLQQAARRIAGLDGALDRRQSLDLLLSLGAAPAFPDARLTFVYDFPACQAALARISRDDSRVAHRFEVFCGPLELANGYDELCDADELAMRLQNESGRRRRAGSAPMAVDRRLLQATRAGIEPCSGVALGVDRLLMVLGGCSDIAAVLEFPNETA